MTKDRAVRRIAMYVVALTCESPVRHESLLEELDKLPGWMIGNLHDALVQANKGVVPHHEGMMLPGDGEKKK